MIRLPSWPMMFVRKLKITWIIQEISKSQLSVKQEQQMLLSKCRRVRRALFYWLKVRLGLGPKFQVELATQKKFTWRLVVQAFLG